MILQLLRPLLPQYATNLNRSKIVLDYIVLAPDHRNAQYQESDDVDQTRGIIRFHIEHFANQSWNKDNFENGNERIDQTCRIASFGIEQHVADEKEDWNVAESELPNTHLPLIGE